MGRYGKLAEKLQDFVRHSMSRDRYAHSLRVAHTARALALHYGKNPHKAWFAGLTHDIAREWEPEEMLRVARLDGLPISSLEEEKPILLHGRAAAWVLFTRFDVHGRGVLEAIRHHTLGMAGMGAQAMILFAADYLEPGRSFVSTRFRRSTHDLGLEQVVMACIEHNIERGKDPDGRTLDLARWLVDRGALYTGARTATLMGREAP